VERNARGRARARGEPGRAEAELHPYVLIPLLSTVAAAILATAILDGLLHHCDVININGPSYRLKDRLTLIAGGEPMT